MSHEIETPETEAEIKRIEKEAGDPQSAFECCMKTIRFAQRLERAKLEAQARVEVLRDKLALIIRVNSNTDSENEEDRLPDIHEIAESALEEPPTATPLADAQAQIAELKAKLEESERLSKWDEERELEWQKTASAFRAERAELKAKLEEAAIRNTQDAARRMYEHESLVSSREHIRDERDAALAELTTLKQRLDEIQKAADADQADLDKMRDGTKLTRGGLVQAIVFAQQDRAKLQSRLDAAEKERDAIKEGHAHSWQTAREIIASHQAEIAELKAERDHWKANAKNQAELRRTICTRPDLGNRAPYIEKIMAERDTALAELATVREQLKAEYGRGVAAGKQEALNYTEEERKGYGLHVAGHKQWSELIAERDSDLHEAARLRNLMGEP